MARSDYIYAVMRPESGEDGLLAAFTVKYEMVRWLGWQDDTSGMHVLRMRDGYAGCKRVEVAELLGAA